MLYLKGFDGLSPKFASTAVFNACMLTAG
jgi:hypothetical protein